MTSGGGQAAADSFSLSVISCRMFGIRRLARYLGLEADACEYAYLHPATRSVAYCRAEGEYEVLLEYLT